MSLATGAFFAVGTAIELYLLKVVGGYISILNTISWCMFTFLVGMVLGRSWGNEYIEKMQWHLRSHTVPGDDVLNGAVMVVSSVLLITPGVITDFLGLLIAIPMTRGIFRGIAQNMVKKKISQSELYFFFKD